MRIAGISSAKDLGGRSGLHPSTISRWIAGRSRPTRENLQVIAVELDVPALSLMLKAGLVDPDDVESGIPSALPDELQELADWYAAIAAQRPDCLDGLVRRINDICEWADLIIRSPK